MAAYTAQQVWDRISSVCADHPFEYRRAADPFSFDLQPKQVLDKSFHLEMEHEATDGYLGYAQAEIELLRIYVLREIRRDPHGVHRQLMTDVNSLVSAVLRDGAGSDYNAELVNWRVPEPEPGRSYVVGMIEVTVDYDRSF